MRETVKDWALRNGMIQLDDTSGTNISVQLFDLAKINPDTLHPDIRWDTEKIRQQQPIMLVMDYAFGEQAYESFDELFKPFEKAEGRQYLNIASLSIMGKAGILEGAKGDLMVPTAHVFEGTADNYPLDNQFSKMDFEGFGLKVFEGPMITVLGTSLQNRDILS